MAREVILSTSAASVSAPAPVTAIGAAQASVHHFLRLHSDESFLGEAVQRGVQRAHP